MIPTELLQHWYEQASRAWGESSDGTDQPYGIAIRVAALAAQWERNACEQICHTQRCQIPTVVTPYGQGYENAEAHAVDALHRTADAIRMRAETCPECGLQRPLGCPNHNHCDYLTGARES